jgi:hypothetical protein
MSDELKPFADEQPAPVWSEDSEGQPVSPVEAVLPVESTPADEQAAAGSGKVWLRELFGGDHRQARIDDLSARIEAEPEAPVNYVFRGELYLKAGDYELAAADFQQALAAAAAEIETANWGLVAQTVRDRALNGLKQSQRRLNR